MFRCFKSETARRVTLMLYALAMVLVGFAHHPGRASSSVDLSAYTMPDGSVPFICGGSETDGTPAADGSICEACCLTAAPGLLSPTGGIARPEFRTIDVGWPARPSQVMVPATTSPFSARAPPLPLA